MDWKETAFLKYVAVNKLMKEVESTKIAQLLLIEDKHIIDVYNALYPAPRIGESDVSQAQSTLSEVLARFDDYFTPKINVAMEAFKFNSIVQKEYQPFGEFETDLRRQIQHCDFKCGCGKSYQDRTLRDRIIIGVFDKTLQLKLLNSMDDLLDNVIEKCKIIEATIAIKVILQGEPANIMNIGHFSKFCKHSKDTRGTGNYDGFVENKLKSSVKGKSGGNKHLIIDGMMKVYYIIVKQVKMS